MLVIIVGGIPIAMPTVLSVTLALGAYKLAKEGAIVARMSAVEEMAGMDILCSDKTGQPCCPCCAHDDQIQDCAGLWIFCQAYCECQAQARSWKPAVEKKSPASMLIQLHTQSVQPGSICQGLLRPGCMMLPPSLAGLLVPHPTVHMEATPSLPLQRQFNGPQVAGLRMD